MVEFAMVAPLLFLLVFGIVDFGSIYNSSLAVRQGVRDGARQAAVGVFGTDAGTGGSACALTPSSGTGDTDADKIICLTKSRIGLTNSNVRVAVALGSGGYAVGQPIVLCAQTPATSLSGFTSSFVAGKYIKSKVQMRIETLGSSPATGAGAVTVAETAPTGSSWAFCTVQ